MSVLPLLSGADHRLVREVVVMKKRDGSARVGSTFSENLSQVLKERGISVRAAGELAGVSSSTISGWANGTASPLDMPSVQRLAKALSVNFEWLLCGTAETSTPVKIEDAFDISKEPTLSGFFEIQIRRIKPKAEKK
jgi:transcriptional regulator with XRE-family HTH domain